jgi:hypothetical protein
MTEALVSKLVDNILSVFFCHRRTQSCHIKKGRYPVFPIQPQLKVTQWSFFTKLEQFHRFRHKQRHVGEMRHANA